MVDIDPGAEIAMLFLHDPAGKLLLATKEGRGFVAAQTDLVANTRKGKQVLVVDPPDAARFAVPVAGDMVGIVGENRKLLAFALSEVPEMPRGKGVRLITMKDGAIADIKTYAGSEGLTWQDAAGRTFAVEPIAEYVAKRAGAGRVVPRGFPRSGRFRG
jgi:topoisomerase IV subunit A